MSEDEVVAQVPELTPGESGGASLDLPGDPEVGLSWQGNGWIASGVSHKSDSC